MTIPKEIIEKAIAGGWEAKYPEINGGYHTMFPFEPLKNADMAEIHRISCKGSNAYKILLDPTFWQALGKELEWENADDWEEADPNEMIEAMSMIQEHAQLEVKGAPVIPQLGPHWWFIHDSYQRKAHDFYDLILQGKDTEKFWKDLLVTK